MMSGFSIPCTVNGLPPSSVEYLTDETPSIVRVASNTHSVLGYWANEDDLVTPRTKSQAETKRLIVMINMIFMVLVYNAARTRQLWS